MRINLLNILKKRKLDLHKSRPSLSTRPKIRTVTPTNKPKDFNEWAEYIHETCWSFKYSFNENFKARKERIYGGGEIL
jgi:hypothetical protein